MEVFVLTSILIPTFSDDDHSRFVAAALDVKGVNCIRWFTADYPSQQSHVIKIGANGLDLFRVFDEISELNIDEKINCVWFRRFRRPYTKNIKINPESHQFVLMSNEIYHANIMNLLSDSKLILKDAFWVNHPMAAKICESKIVQLLYASRVGFNVPRSIITNNMDEARNFIRINKSCIRKSMFTFHWIQDNKGYVNYTSDINISDTERVGNIQPCSEIIQQKIESSFEVRSVVIGTTIFSIRINNKIEDLSVSDWRYHAKNKLKCEPYELSSDHHEMIISLMRILNLSSASFDFIVSRDNELYFIEINQSGQFLWIEDIVPDLPILDAFTNFLISGDINYRHYSNDDAISLRSLSKTNEFKFRKAEEISHVRPESPYD